MSKRQITFVVIAISTFLAVMLFVRSQSEKNTALMASPASSSGPSGERSLSSTPTLDQVYSLILEVNTAEDIEKNLTKLESLAEVKSPIQEQIKMFYLALAPLRKLKGFLWRIEHWAYGSIDTRQSYLETLRTVRHKFYLLGPHLQALFNYLTLKPEGSKLGSLDSANQINDELVQIIGNAATPVPGTLQAFVAQAKAVTAANPALSFKLDARIFLGRDGFLVSSEIEKTVLQPHLQLVIAYAEYLSGFVKYAAAYDLNGIQHFLGLLYARTIFNASTLNPIQLAKGLGSLISGDPQYITQSITANQIRSVFSDITLDKKLFTLREPRKALLGESLAHFQSGSLFDYNGFSLLAAASVTEPNAYIVDPYLFKIYGEKRVDARKWRVEMLKGRTNFISSVTGGNITIDATALFKPRSDLKVYYPIQADTNSDSWTYGLPTAWTEFKPKRAEAYSAVSLDGFLPGANASNIQQMLRDLYLTPATEPIVALIPIFP